MTNQQYRTIGFFYAYYESNLNHILHFQRFKQSRKQGKLTFEEYMAKGKYSFPKFLSDFKVARNVEKEKIGDLLRVTSNWINGKKSVNVDDFAILLKDENFTHGKVMTSLASKILFLNNPYKILPIDSQVKKSVVHKTNRYAEYVNAARKKLKEKKFQAIEKYVDHFAKQVEKQYSEHLPKIERIRVNRLLDIFLWSNNGPNQE